MIKPCIGGSESVLGEKCTDHLNLESYFYAITIMSDIQTLDNSFPARIIRFMLNSIPIAFLERYSCCLLDLDYPYSLCN